METEFTWFVRTYGTVLMGGLSALGILVTWLIADTRSKSRLIFMEERVNSANLAQNSHISLLTSKVSSLEVNESACAQDRLSLHGEVSRLDSSKASKDVVDTLRQDIDRLRETVDRRCDRLEALIEKKNNSK